MSTTTDCGCLTQFLSPDLPPDLIVCNNQGAPEFQEGRTDPLIQGQAFGTISFRVQKAGVDYDFDELEVENITDSSPLQIRAQITNRTEFNFSFTLNSTPDTANYRLRWAMHVNTV